MHPSTETIFLQAIDLPKRERAAFLDKSCGGSPQLRAAVEAHVFQPGLDRAQQIFDELGGTRRAFDPRDRAY